MGKKTKKDGYAGRALSDAAKEQATEIAATAASSHAPTMLEGWLGSTVAALLSHGVNAVEPHVGVFYLGYKVARADRNIEELKRQIDRMVADSALTTTKDAETARMILECSLDAAIQERDIEKIKYLAHGTIEGLTSEIVSASLHDDFVAMLLQCTVTDLVILEDLYTDPIKVMSEYPAWMARRGLTQQSVDLSTTKMRRLALFADRTPQAIQTLGERVNQFQDVSTNPRRTNTIYPHQLNARWGQLSPIGGAFVEYFIELRQEDQEANENPPS